MQKMHDEILRGFGFTKRPDDICYRHCVNGYFLNVFCHHNTFELYINTAMPGRPFPLISGLWSEDSLRLYNFLTSIIKP